MAQKTITIEGMRCKSCVALVTEEFMNVENITKVTVDLPAQEAVIEYQNGDLDMDYLNSLITPLGFTVTGEK